MSYGKFSTSFSFAFFVQFKQNSSLLHCFLLSSSVKFCSAHQRTLSKYLVKLSMRKQRDRDERIWIDNIQTKSRRALPDGVSSGRLNFELVVQSLFFLQKYEQTITKYQLINKKEQQHAWQLCCRLNHIWITLVPHLFHVTFQRNVVIFTGCQSLKIAPILFWLSLEFSPHLICFKCALHSIAFRYCCLLRFTLLMRRVCCSFFFSLLFRNFHVHIVAGCTFCCCWLSLCCVHFV